MMLAAENGRVDVVRYLVEYGDNKETKSSSGWTAMMIAAQNGHVDVVRYLVECGAEKAIKDKNGVTAMMLAAKNGHADVVQYLVECGAEMDTKDLNDVTALLWAATSGHLDVVQYLLARGADGLSVDKDETSALLHLLMRDDINEVRLHLISKLLLERGLHPYQLNKHGQSIKVVAVKKNFHGVLALIEEYMSKPKQCEPEPEDQSWLIPHSEIEKTHTAAIAEGCFGCVYRAKWAHTDVVVKELSVVEMRRFLKEVNVWRGLRHDNVVPFNGANHRQEPFFIVSKYATNGELVPYLQHEKSKGRTVTWRKLHDVAAGLRYLHQREIVHGDLKGNNIVVSSNGTAMLTDFGLSFFESGSCSYIKSMKNTLGAMAWRAPEYANMTVMTPTRKSDVYSLGMCIIEAVTGKKPWGGYTSEEIRCFLRDGKIRVERPSASSMTEDQWQLVQRRLLSLRRIVQISRPSSLS